MSHDVSCPYVGRLAQYWISIVYIYIIIYYTDYIYTYDYVHLSLSLNIHITYAYSILQSFAFLHWPMIDTEGWEGHVSNIIQ